MKRRHHTPEQIVRKLREADRFFGEGSSSGGRCVSTWRSLSRGITGGVINTAGLKCDDAKRLKELERENSRLKKIVADQGLDIDLPQLVNLGNF